MCKRTIKVWAECIRDDRGHKKQETQFASEPRVSEKDFWRGWHSNRWDLWKGGDMVSILQEPLKILKKGRDIPESNLKVWVRVRVKAKCVVKRVSVEGVGERDPMGRPGLQCSARRGARQSSAFYQVEWASPRAEWRGRETPDFLSSCWNAQALGEGRNREEWETEER